jgi:hypothetical protein
MKNPYEVIRVKEQEMNQIRKEVEALRIAARLLGDEPSANESSPDQHQVLEMP